MSAYSYDVITNIGWDKESGVSSFSRSSQIIVSPDRIPCLLKCFLQGNSHTMNEASRNELIRSDSLEQCLLHTMLPRTPSILSRLGVVSFPIAHADQYCRRIQVKCLNVRQCKVEVIHISILEVERKQSSYSAFASRPCGVSVNES